MGTRGRKIIRDILARKGRTLLVALAIFIGVTGTITLFSLSDIIVRQLEKDIKQDELPMIQVFTTVNSEAELDDAAYLEALRTQPEVTEIMSVFQGNGYFKINPEAEDFETGFLQAYSVPYTDGLPMTPMRLLEGAYPQNDTEVAIETRMADEYGLNVGDQIYFRILSPSKDPAQNGQIGTVEARTVSGLVFHAYAQSPDSSIYTSVEDGNYIGGIKGYSGYFVRFTDYDAALEQQDAFSQVVASETPYIPIFTFAEDPAQNSQIQSARTIGSTMGTLALIALIVSGFLVVNVITSIIVEQKRQIGVMKSMGATYMDNVLMYCGIAFMYGVFGVIPGIIIGIPLGNLAAQGLAPQLNTVLDGFQISQSSIFIGALVGLLIPVLASIIPVFSGVRVKILDAMTDLGISAVTTPRAFKLYEPGKPIITLILILTMPFRLIWRAMLFLMIELPLRLFLLLPVPISLKQAFRNLLAKQTRIAFTMITLAVAAGAFMGIFSVFNTITSGFQSFFDLFNAQVIMIPTESLSIESVNALVAQNFQTDEAQIEADLDAYLAENFTAEEAAALRQPLLDARSEGISENEVLRVLMNTPTPLPDTLDDEDLARDILANAETPGTDPLNGVDTSALAPELVERLPELVTQVQPLYTTLRKTNNVVSVEPGFQIQVEFEGYDPLPSAGGPPGIFAYGYAVESENPAFNFDITEGEALTLDNAENGIVFTTQLARNMDKQVGDVVTMVLPGGTADLTIMGITEYPIDQVFIDWRTIAKISGYVLGAPVADQYNVPVQVNDATATAWGVSASSLEQLASAFSVETDGLIISEAFAEANTLSVGDTVTVTANGNSAEYPIGGIVTLPPQIAEENEITDTTVVIDFQTLVELTGASLEGEPVPQAYFVTTDNSEASVRQVEDVMDSLNEVALDQGLPSQFFNVVEFIETFSQIFGLFQAIFSAVAGLIALVGALGLLTTLSMSVFERQKEIGVMRSIGAGSSTVALQFLTEGLVVGLIAWLIGLPLAYLIQAGLLEVTQFSDTFAVEMQWSAVILGFVGIMGFTILASLWPSLSAARRTVSDILRYQ